MSTWTEELDRRLMQPRIALWIGADYVRDNDLESDLSALGIHLRAIYLDLPETRFERILENASFSGRSRLASVLDEDDADTWEPDDLGLFYLRGNERDQELTDRDLARRYFGMASTLRKVAAAEPALVVVVAGVEKPEEASFLIEYAADIPVVWLGDAVKARAVTAPYRLPEDRIRPYIDWNAFRVELQHRGISVFPRTKDVAIQAGRYRISLSEIFSDPYLRLDDQWRIISTSATAPPPADEPLTELFVKYLEGDERRLAGRVEEDLAEWWAANAGLPFERHAQKEISGSVLSTLEHLSGSDYRDPRICWLPAESASGLTRVLHHTALAAANGGFPTFVLKQLVTALDQNKLSNFLTAIHEISLRMAREAGDQNYRERPVLLVLDAEHAGVPEIEGLLDVLVRRHGRQVLTLWGVNVDVGTPSPGNAPANRHYRNRFRGLVSRRPQASDTFLPLLRARVEPEELRAFATHCESLRTDRNLDLPYRSYETWQRFQEVESKYIEKLIVNLPIERAEKEDALAAFAREELFWPMIAHFLTSPAADPIADALGRRIAGLLEGFDGSEEGPDDPIVSAAALLYIAKAWTWGLLMPDTALIDWLKRHEQQLRPLRTARAEDDVPASTGTREGVISLAERLQASWIRARRLPGTGSADAGMALRALLNRLEAKGWIRQHWLGAANWIRFQHHSLARAFLLSAHGIQDRLPAELRDVLGRPGEAIDREKAFEGFAGILECLQPNPANIHFAQILSEGLLLGTDESHYWKEGRGEDRLEAYETVPSRIRDRSRVLKHHHAIVLRRTTFDHRLSLELRTERLERAKLEIAQALEMPWQIGVRDEHPAHLRTTLALVLRSLEELAHDRRTVHELRRQAENLLRQALLEVPDSGHTRFALAKALLASAEEFKENREIEQAMSLAAEILDVLSVDPTGQDVAWYDTKRHAADLFGDQEGQRFLTELKKRGVEAAFLLEAEGVLAREGDSYLASASHALNILADITRAENAHHNPRAAYRAARLLADVLPTEVQERYRLLKAAEAGRVALGAKEEFDLAVLTYFHGDYRDGAERFSRLRSSGRASIVADERRYFTDIGTRDPMRLRGRVDSYEGGRGWMWIFREGERLFRAPFQGQHFGYERKAPTPGITWEEVLVRFTGLGPKAVPQRFYFASEKGSQESVA